MKKSVRLYITGTVQGVFFRQFIKESADKLDIRGYVRNIDDGRVEMFLEGNLENVNKMIEVCKNGQRHSQIRNVEIKDERFQDLKDFKILHM